MAGKRSTFFRLRMMEFGRRTILRPATDVLVKRDFWVFFREPSQWLHLLLMMLLLLIFLVSLSSMTLKLSQPLLQAVSFLVIFLFNGFLIASISLRFVFPAVSLEGRTFWAVRSSPVSLKKLYWYKFAFTFAMILLVGEVLAVTSIALLRNNPVLVLLSAVCTAFMALALTGMNLGAGTFFATFREKNPIRIASSQGASLTFLVAMVYLAIVVGVLILPLHSYFENLIIFGTTSEGWMNVPVAVIGVMSVGLFVVSSRIGVRSLYRDY
jgi:ABC-2 type transport system permease protein